MNYASFPHAARVVRVSLMVLPVACAMIAGCSGGSSSPAPKAQATSPAVAAPPSSGAPVAAATTPGGSCDTCGQTEPVLFLVGTSYDGSRPATIDLSVDTPNSNVVSGLAWSSWPSGSNGAVAASATATGTGKVTNNGTSQTVTITLSDPTNGDPSYWQTLTEQIQGQHQAVYHYNGLWATSASGGDLQH